MYTQFFNLKQSPFSIAPDPRYLFMSERHREALAHLLYGVGSGGGFVLLTGEIGTGKTTICRCFIEQIPENCKLAYIFYPKLSAAELLLSICDEFQIQLELAPHGSVSIKTCVDAINTYLLSNHAQGLSNVLIIDEAQSLSADVLEQLRLLTNLETNERKLLQIILIGQPELRTVLARPELEQLAQRVIARYHLDALSSSETVSYIAHRLAVAGAMAGTAAPFSRRALQRIHRLSKGVPRRINLLCDRALLGAYVENLHQVSSHILRQAAAEVFAEAAPSAVKLRWPQVLAGVMTGAIIASVAVWLLPHSAIGTVFNPVPAQATPIPAPVSSADALRELAALWGEALPDGEPCQMAAKLNLRCHQGKGGLPELRLLNRPAMLSLRNDLAPPSHVLLVGLNKNQARLRIGGKDQWLDLTALISRFDGEFMTFWRAPYNWRDYIAAGDRGPDVDWLAGRLAQLHGLKQPQENQALDANMQRLLREFQINQKLKADGVAGPKTFIRLISLNGSKEPRLLDAMPNHDAMTGK